MSPIVIDQVQSPTINSELDAILTALKNEVSPAPYQMQPQFISHEVLSEKYLKAEEKTADDLFARVAYEVAGAELPEKREYWANRFFQNMRSGGLGAGRIMSSAGTGIQATLINCFVQPVGDSISGDSDDGYPGIYDALTDAANTMRRGGGVGYDFSRIRPRGAYVKGTHSMASGPCSYIDVFDKSCATVESAGARRGAQMGVLRIDHPDVLEFITAKRTPGRWNNFNVSIAVSEAFMNAVENNLFWDLVHKAEPTAAKKAEGAKQREDGLWIYTTIPAVELWDTVMQSTYDFAEPGILFLDRANEDNNLRYCETFTACNPCAEQFLPAYGCCDLGPVNLTRFVKHPFGFNGTPTFDYAGFAKSVATQVRLLDNVLDVTFWPLPQQRAESENKRRIGVGFTGLGDTLTMLKLAYNTTEARETAVLISQTMRDTAYTASVELAKERGPFPLLDAEKYLEEGTFASRLPEAIKDAIRTHGIRNSHLLSIAPVGTVSLAFADNASNGIEPAFSWTYDRKKRNSDGSHTIYPVEDYAYRLFKHLGGDGKALPSYFVTALEISATDHIAMMECVQPYIDSAISKTVNVPVDYPFESFKSLYREAWKAKLKGVATYRPNATLGAVLIAPGDDKKKETPVPVAPVTPIDPMRSVIKNRPLGRLTAAADKIEYWTQQEGKKTLYVIVSFLPVQSEDGRTVDRAVEFFMPVGQNGESQQWITSSMRLLSLAARGGFLDRALSDMRKVAWDRGPVRLGFLTKADGSKAPIFHDSEVAAIAYQIQQIIESRVSTVTQEIALAPVIVDATAEAISETAIPLMAGKKCGDCGAHAVVNKDGCEFCTNCGMTGSCG